MSGAILIIQTAFAGDLVLTTPLIEEAASMYPGVPIDLLCIPATAPLLANHPLLRKRIVYDKKNGDPALPALLRSLGREQYTLCLCPHRSFRSAMLARATKAPRRISFDRSAAPWLFTETVKYQADWHEADRVLSLLLGGEQPEPGRRGLRLFPSDDDRAQAEAWKTNADGPYVCIAPGSVWATKRWTEEGFIETARHFSASRTVFLLGGREDRELCARIASGAQSDPPAGTRPIISTAGELGFLASAALVGEADVLISNDSAPVHIAAAMKTPVVEIFGATDPAFGFTPYQVPHRIVMREDLDCRPCAIHGGKECPIGTFVCMRELGAQRVIRAAEELLP